jgi:death-on-curing protein
MSGSPVFLRTKEVLAIHRRLVQAFGGSALLRDAGLLESAVHMLAAGLGGKFLHGTIPAMAAAYLFHLCKSHPFVDGNERTDLVAAEIFLMVNGHRLKASDRDL